jgi:hypothetical protein
MIFLPMDNLPINAPTPAAAPLAIFSPPFLADFFNPACF